LEENENKWPLDYDKGEIIIYLKNSKKKEILIDY